MMVLGTKQWLSSIESEPEIGWNTQKFNSNRTNWAAQARKEYDEWEQTNGIALGVISQICSYHCQTLIKSETTANSAWKTLQ